MSNAVDGAIVDLENKVADAKQCLFWKSGRVVMDDCILVIRAMINVDELRPGVARNDNGVFEAVLRARRLGSSSVRFGLRLIERFLSLLGEFGVCGGLFC